MAVAGQTRFRRNQFAKQTVIGTAVAATRRVPWRGPIVVNPNRTDPDVDVGSLDPVVSPFPTARDVDGTKEGPIAFNDLPIRWSAGGKGGVSPTGGGTAKTWTFQLASLTADAFDYWTNEFGDDTEATDGIIGFGGVIDTLEESMPEDLGPWTINDDWIFAGATLGSNLTDGLSVDAAPIWAFGADTQFFLDSAAGSIGITPLTNTVHSATLRISNNLDRKRFANGSNTRFQLANYGRGEREIEFTIVMAKSAAAITEANTLDDDPVPNRYWGIDTQSTALAQTPSTFYRYRRRFPARLFERAEGEIGGNATIELTYRGFYDSTTGYAMFAEIVNTLGALP